MLARSVSILLTDNSLAYTLVTALTSRKNRPLIPALSISVLAVGKWIEILLLSFRIGKENEANKSSHSHAVEFIPAEETNRSK